MKYDCIIIGGGISGLTCGIKCAKEGMSCAVITAGMSALHFSSGSIDLLGYYPDNTIVHTPADVLNSFAVNKPDHPYAKCGPDIVMEALNFLREELSEQELELCSNGNNNHFHVTPVGTLKPTFLSQKSVFNENINQAFKKNTTISIINFKGYRDFNSDIAAVNLKKHRLFTDCTITSNSIDLQDLQGAVKEAIELRSIDISRIFDKDENLHEIAERLKRAAGDSEFIGVPAVAGLENHKTVYEQLVDLTEKIVYEIPTLPPSIPGMRIDRALKSRFSGLGGVLITGDRIIGGTIVNDQVTRVYTKHHQQEGMTARNVVLASGSFFSGGMVAEIGNIKEPIFGLLVDYPKQREEWRSQLFFQKPAHPFLSFGVRTDENLNPNVQNGPLVKNLFCAGAVLAGYNPISEGSGGGVAAGTGYYAALQAKKRCDDIRKGNE